MTLRAQHESNEGGDGKIAGGCPGTSSSVLSEDVSEKKSADVQTLKKRMFGSDQEKIN